MAITRTPIIDDSGSGQDGTVIDNAWKQEFYDQIDAQVAGLGVDWTLISISTEGVVNDWNPGIVGHTILYCINTAALLITGFASTPAAKDGQQIRVVRAGTGEIQLFFYHTGSIVANRLVFPGTSPKILNAQWCSADFMYAANTWQLRAIVL
jgi:hypothetical protein